MVNTASAIFCGVALIAATANSIAGVPGQKPPVHYHAHNVLVEVHKGTGPVNLLPNPQITYLDDPLDVDCDAPEGCLITAQSLVQLPQFSIASICVYLDGQAMQPSCSGFAQGSTQDLQSQLLSAGHHTLQTGLANGYAASGYQANGWIVTYTIYKNRD